MSSLKRLWVEKYRPTTLEEVIYQNAAQKEAFLRYKAEKEFPHLLLSGVQGSGKTTISRAIIKDCEVDSIDVLKVNASKETGVDAMRDKISNFVACMPVGKFKVVRLEEADMLSMQAQGLLRAVIEDFSDTARFIMTCNYENKIIPSIRSRFSSGHYRFSSPAFEDILLRLGEILLNENIDFDPDDLEKVIQIYYPDIRSMIGYLEANSKTGKLIIAKSTGKENSDYKFTVRELVEARKFGELRQFMRTGVAKEDYEEVFRLIYDGVKKAHKNDPTKMEESLITLNDFVFKHGVVALPELNMEALIISLGRI